MKTIVIGLGVQGQKRKRFAGGDYVAAVDPIKPDADYKHITDVPLADYDAALVCLPDEPKAEVLKYLLSNQKHVLVEKPLWTPKREDLFQLQDLALKNAVVLYAAYNHRFEPHLKRVADLIQQNVLGKIYRCRLFYGNGTARIVRESLWRDQGGGVLPDLCSHLLDLLEYWFGAIEEKFTCIDAQCHENNAPDHVVIFNRDANVKIEMEATLLAWRNHFTCDIYAEKGTLHVDSLCKWGPAQFTYRERILPSGRPIEESTTLIKEDPTWAIEYDYFKSLIANRRILNLKKDIWIYDQLNQLTQQALGMSNTCTV